MTRSACKPCGKLTLDLIVWNAFSAVQLVDPLLNGGHEFDPLSDFVQRGLIGQFTNRIQDKFLLRHVANIGLRSR